MKVKFYSYQRGDSNLSFEADCQLIDGGYKFEDKKNIGTSIYVKPISSKEILLKRSGIINSEINYIEGKRTKSMYHSETLSFPFEVNTYNIKVTNNHISFEYDYFYENELIGNIRIVLLIKE